MKWDKTTLTPDIPRRLDTLIVGNTSDARWRALGSSDDGLPYDTLDVQELELHQRHALAEHKRDMRLKERQQQK